MSDLITRNFRAHNAEQFVEQFSESFPDNIYIYIGNSLPWPNEAIPPILSNSIDETEYNQFNNMIAMKKVSSSDVSFSSPRYNWTSGTLYAQYNSSIDFYSSKFYVITDEYKVFKCLGNNNGALSTIKPTATSTTSTTTSDGYVWKYMFTLSAGDAIKFLTSDFFPVKTLLVNDGSTQWDVQQDAIVGSIGFAGITNGGSSYIQNTNTALDGTSNTIKLHGSASASNSVYNGYAVYIISGTGAGQIRTVSGYVGSTRVATVSANWTTTPDNTSIYIVSPRVMVIGDGVDFSAYTEVTAGVISSIKIINNGSGYTYANLSIAGSTGSGAIIYPSLAPLKGHGADAKSELLGHNVTLNTRMVGDETNLIPTGNDFRVVGILVNPKLASNTSANATALVYDMTTKLSISGVMGSFQNDEVIVGQTGGARATIVKNESMNLLSLNRVFGTFSPGEIINGQISSASASVVSITQPLIKKHSGKILYIRNQSPVYRSASQTEDYKITVKF